MKTFMLEVKKAMVLLTEGTDRISLYTELPCPYAVAFLPSQQPLTVTFDATYDTGIEYIRKNFGIEPEVTNVRHG